MEKNIQTAASWLKGAEAILVSASNGLSIAEGYHIFADNEDFRQYFGYFRERYGIYCLIQGIFAQIPEHDRYMQTVHRYLIDDYSGSTVMQSLLRLIQEKDYFVVTSNADTHFQINGFDPERLFEIEGNVDKNVMYSPQWKAQRERFQGFLDQARDKRVVVLELGIGKRNTLIKKPLMDLVHDCPGWQFLTLNLAEEIYIPESIAGRSLPLPGDIAGTFEALLKALPTAESTL